MSGLVQSAPITEENLVGSTSGATTDANAKEAHYPDLIFVNFQFPHNCHTWKGEIPPHDNFFSMNIIPDIRDKYQVCPLLVHN